MLGIETDSTRVCFELDAVLEREYPRFYWPPRRGEQYSYARVRWCLHGEVEWSAGPNLDQPAIDANGEADYGNIDSCRQEDNVDYLEGEWGTVTIRNAQETVDYLEV
ncbi:MAG: hypothetical protein ABIQ73_11405 [Acidimicrobiales bacterium]